MSINANIKSYKIFREKISKNELLEDVKTLEYIGTALIHLAESIKTVDTNGVINNYSTLTGVSNSKDIENGIVIEINNKFFKVVNYPTLVCKRPKFNLLEV